MSSATANITLGDKQQSAFSAVVRKSFSSFSVDSILAGSPSAEIQVTKGDSSAIEEDYHHDEDFRRDSEDFSQDAEFRSTSEQFIRENSVGDDYRNRDEDRGRAGGGGDGAGGDGCGVEGVADDAGQLPIGMDGDNPNFLQCTGQNNEAKYISMHNASAFRIATSAAQAYSLLQNQLNRSSDHPKERRISSDRTPSPPTPCEEDIDDGDDDLHVDSEQEEKDRSDNPTQTILRPTAVGPLQEQRFPGMPAPSLLGHIPQPGLWPSIPFLHHQLSLRALQSECMAAVSKSDVKSQFSIKIK